jgi:CDP-diacylglycerol--glycerol-3-phosphate 3-phosphatidyltransferase
MKIERQHWFYIPNILSLLRLITIPVPIILIAAGHIQAALIIVSLGIISDVADGFLARRLNQVSDLGKILDPLGDKLAMAALALALYWYLDFPFWAVALIIGRDLVILIFGLFTMTKTSSTPVSDWLGKLTAFTWSLLLLSYLTPLTWAQEILIVLAPAMVPLSLINYIVRAYHARSLTPGPSHEPRR